MTIEERIKELVNGHEGAYEFIMNLWSFVVTWDDAIDRDKHGPNVEINSAMCWALLGMQNSTFYRENVKVLHPALMLMIGNWLTANKFEKSGNRALVEQAYFLRCSPYEVFNLVILLANGYNLDKAMAGIEYFRGSFREDSMESYLKEHLGE